MKYSDKISDVIIIGGGLAGLYAANTACINFPSLKISLLTHDELGSGGCSKRTHGINVATNEVDSWEFHLKDTIEGGGGINNRELAKILCQNIIEQIKELESIGVRFDREKNESYNVGTYGGNSYSRSLHIYDITGLILVQEMVKQVILNGCYIKEYRWAVELNKQNEFFSVVVFNELTNQIENYYSKAIVLATGGGACVYPISSISSDKLASGIIMAYNLGASLIDMEMVQFHPTGVLIPGSPGNGSLLEEEMRTQGGILLNKYGKRYMLDYDERGELATRDIVARSSFMEIIEGRGTEKDGVIFDISMIDKNKLLNRFPLTLKRLRSWGVDLLTQDKIEISPTAHFLMGGLSINPFCETDIKGLFACGEDAGGIHGSNRLGGNGVAETLVFGKIAGLAAGKFALNNEVLFKLERHETINYYNLNKNEFKDIDSNIKDLMWKNVGLIRNFKGLENALENLREIKDKLDRNKLANIQSSDKLYHEKILFGRILMNKIELALLITRSAIQRGNSLGSHYRIDNDGDQKKYNIKIKINKENFDEIVLKEEIADS